MTHSQEFFTQAQALIPGGVNSPVRAFKGVGGDPVFFKQGKGAYLIDVDDKTYIDYVGSWGPLILGHCHEQVVKAVMDVLQSGMSFGAPTQLEITLAQKIIDLMPSIEKIRMVNSGTEATMTAIRLARGFTKRTKFIKFNGCYHGHSDSLLVKAGSGVLTLSIPSSAGIPAELAEKTLIADFNNLEQTTRLFEQYGEDIAAVIVEPVAGNMGMVLPQPALLQGVGDLCDANTSALINTNSTSASLDVMSLIAFEICNSFFSALLGASDFTSATGGVMIVSFLRSCTGSTSSVFTRVFTVCFVLGCDSVESGSGLGGRFLRR